MFTLEGAETISDQAACYSAGVGICHAVRGLVVLRRIAAGAVVFLLMAHCAAAGPFEDGFAAYEQREFERAQGFWRPLAEQGDAAAQYNLGTLYYQGQGLAQDYGEALRWWRMAADQGFAEAQYGIGLMYEFGQGVEKSDATAATWFRSAAEQDEASAQYRLGLMYLKGLGVPQDYVLAYMWLNLADALENTDAAKERDALAVKMTADQLAGAQQLVRDWQPEATIQALADWPQEEVVLQRLEPIWQEKPAVARALLRRSPVSGASIAATTKRLKVVNGCKDYPMWITYDVGSGGGTLVAPALSMLAAGDPGGSIEYDIPDKGLASTRFWPKMFCNSDGQECKIGQSANAGYLPQIGPGPGIDSKFEGTFGCFNSVAEGDCQVNPSSGKPLDRIDSWDTTMVDGYTLPYKVEVDPPPGMTCTTAPDNNVIDCSNLTLSSCPADENLSEGGAYPNHFPGQYMELKSLDLKLKYPLDDTIAGCYSPCSKLTTGQWHSPPPNVWYKPTDPQAEWYCCPDQIFNINNSDSIERCRNGPVASTGYVNLIHNQCPNTYAYSYDDKKGLFACPAGTMYTVTFYCPQ